MFAFEEDALLVSDREDLIAVLSMRFGPVPAKVVEAIYEIDQLDALQSLILAAANVPRFEMFLKELQENEAGFRLVGERFNPMTEMRNEEDSRGL